MRELVCGCQLSAKLAGNISTAGIDVSIALGTDRTSWPSICRLQAGVAILKKPQDSKVGGIEAACMGAFTLVGHLCCDTMYCDIVIAINNKTLVPAGGWEI
jgi:hypothetical protein